MPVAPSDNDKTGEVRSLLSGTRTCVQETQEIAHLAASQASRTSEGADGVAVPRAPLTDEQAMRVVINASDSLNITRVHELGGKTRTICDEAGLLEIVRAVEKAHGIAGVPPSDGGQQG